MIIGVYVAKKLMKAMPADLIKIMTGYVQVAASLTTVYRVDWPPELVSMLSPLRSFMLNVTELLGVKCMVNTDFFSNMAATLLVTLPLMIVLVLAYIVFRKFSLLKAALVFQTFDCEEVEGAWYLMADYEIQCYDGRWWMFATIAMIVGVGYTLGFPLGVPWGIMLGEKACFLRGLKFW